MVIEGIPMARARRRFGPLFYVTAGFAVIVAASIPFWETGIQQFRAWQLTKRLHNPVESVRREAAEKLVQLGSSGTWWVIRTLGDPDPRARVLCCSILGRTVTDRTEPIVEALLTAVHDSDPSVRVAAVDQLEALLNGRGSMREEPLREKALMSLRGALDDDTREVRQIAVERLAWLGPRAKSAIGDLERTLTGADKTLRHRAGAALLKIDPETTRPRVIAALSELLADHSVRFEHYQIVQVLVYAQGQEATAAMLAPLLRHPDLETRVQAINDLTGQCWSARSLNSLLIEAMSSGPGGVRDQAALYLVEYDPRLRSRALDVLAEQIVDPLEGTSVYWDLIKDVRNRSRGSLGPLAERLVDRLSRAQKPDSRSNAIMALGEIGPDALTAVPVLLKLSQDADDKTATRAVGALVKIDPKSAATRVTSLIDGMARGRESTVRLSAMASLRDLGPAAMAAIPALLKAADEDDLPIAAGALEAISRIDPTQGIAAKQAMVNDGLKSRDD
jgi:HEAT repeat protein